MGKHKGLLPLRVLCVLLPILLLSDYVQADQVDNQHYMPPLECYDPYGRPQRCIPEFENAAFDTAMHATNTCGDEDEVEFCQQTGYSHKKSCEVCRRDDHAASFLTDLHDPHRPTWWQSETMFEGIQYPNHVNLTLNLGKSYDITYIRLVFYSPRPESFSIYKRITPNGQWVPYQHYSATCRTTYNLPDSHFAVVVKKGEDEARALCTSEYSDISPLKDGNIAFSTLESRPSAIEFENSIELQNWVTATDIKISLDRLNTFGDEVFGDTQVLRSYFYAIADIAVGARCKCNGHASNCIMSTGLNGTRSRVCECKHNTDGPDCDRCLPFYNDAPWGRATSKNVNECKACNCNGYSSKCYFDQHLYNLTGHGGHCIDCAANRDGPNCERCKDNFYLLNEGHCHHCSCNPVGSRSLQCNGEGKCQCKPGVTGEKCDRCDANYYNFGNHGCSPCNCDAAGSLDNTPSCDSETGVCVCKDNVEGTHCRDCKPGFFNLDLDNRFGCTPCFCYGHTSECGSANAYGSVSVLSGFHKHIERWTATDTQSPWVKTDLKFNKYSQSVGVGSHGSEYVYFIASDRFLGDQRASYNRVLKFRLQLIGQSGPNPSPSDVILEGAGTSISLPIFAQGHPIPDQQSREYAFRLHEHPDYSWQPSQTARGFMSILSNLTAVKIRASYAQIGEAYLDDVELQTAQRGAAGPTARWVEQCSCPEGYIGQFCESCAPGFRHSPANGGSFMPCVPCDCHKHADICDSETGRCICQHNTAGDTCDQCARGYYGNALSGTPYDCKRCPCPNNGACMTMADDSIICLECPLGYFGQRCESCADGFYGDPTGIQGPVKLCQGCDCNGNVDPNAVGNCNRTTGDCLKCIYNTAGENCDQCLPGYFGDPLAIPHGHCDQCSCYPAGTEQNDDGISICEPVTGACRCKPNVKGRDCNECQNGFFNIHSGNGCEGCNCDPLGSYNSSCSYDGQCFCKPGVTGKRCDQCAQYQYGFSSEGCKPCDCDESGSQGFQCDEFGQCPCNANVEGQRCDRCKENKYDRHHGCLDCEPCYDLVQDAANDHRAKLKNMKKLLQDIASTPTVINDDQFEAKIKAVQEKFDILYEDAKSGAGGGNDKTVLERVEDLQVRLENVQKILAKSDEAEGVARMELVKANGQVAVSNVTIHEARRHLQDALERLQTEGNNALALAKDRSDQFGSQSDQISEISREARAQADALEKKAQENRDIAQEAHKKALDAYDMARDAYGALQKVNDELSADMYGDLEATSSDLKKTVKKVDDAQRRADKQYDEALSLFATVSSLSPPEVNIDHIKVQTKKNNDEADKIESTIKEMKEGHAKLLEEVNFNTEHSIALLSKADKQREDAIKLLEEAKTSNEIAKEAVAQGDGTLKEANDTYHILSGFSNKVSESSVSAEAAMKVVPNIEAEIANSEEMIRDAERAILDAFSNANAAKENAEKAQQKYAETASKDAEKIREDATNTKDEARKLSSEADQLAGRVVATETKIGKLEAAARKDDELTEMAKESVNQAQTNSMEASKQVMSAMKAVNEIIEELNGLRDINEGDLDDLDRRLSEAEEHLGKANLSMRMETLNEYKNYHNLILKEHTTNILHLEQEVATIMAIANTLPMDCFKRTRLEPI